jgi:hypothetical protein
MADISMFKIEKGKVKALDVKGNYIKVIGDANAIDARLQGDGITIAYENGKTKLYDIKGNFKKYL